jgi:NAD(P)-dependent dehydrogenase (short-subunit alcohol dehydrogenase family)
VAIAARRKDACQHLCHRIRSRGGNALAVSLDVTDASSIDAAMDQTAEGLGRLDIVVNNAGVAGTAPLLDTEESQWDRILDTNLKGAYLVAKAAAQLMRSAGKGGCIVNVASILAFRIANQIGPYAASKAALLQLTRVMALEWARFNVRVNALCPGYIETDLNREFFSSAPGQELVRRIPQRRLGQPSDLDAPLLLLCSPASSFMTGSSIVVDGGHLVSSL